MTVASSVVYAKKITAKLQLGRLSFFREPLNIQRAESDEKIFRQTKQKSARRVYPLRRVFGEAPTPWASGKDSADSLRDEFLEVPFILIVMIIMTIQGHNGHYNSNDLQQVVYHICLYLSTSL